MTEPRSTGGLPDEAPHPQSPQAASYRNELKRDHCSPGRGISICTWSLRLPDSISPGHRSLKCCALGEPHFPPHPLSLTGSSRTRDAVVFRDRQ